MKQFLHEEKNKQRITLGVMSNPAKALSTCIIFILSMGMVGATGQIVVHDLIPTFYSKSHNAGISVPMAGHDDKSTGNSALKSKPERGDLFSELSPIKSKAENKPFYENEQFVWTLKWTHIHLFGMGVIFIFMGTISLLLDASARLRAWLIVLPFIGVLIDILTMWLKVYVSPLFFWLHLAGGGIFGLIFGYVSLRALWEMWIKP